jgi:hypothetical protein
MTNISSVNYTFNYTVSTVGPATLNSSSAATQRPGNSSRDAGHPGISEGSTGAVSAIDAILAHSAGGDSTWVTGVTPVLAPGDSFAAGKMELLIPEIRTSVEQHVIYTVSPVENPNLVKKDTVFVTIDAPVPVFVSSFIAEALDGGVRLVWDVVSDEAIAGFKIYRRLGGEEKMVLANREGLIAVDATEYVDNEAEPGRDYEYALGVVLVDGGEVLSQAAAVKTKTLTFALRQNVPNPFNPTTTIGFTVPERGHVALTIYNVEGKRVATLVDEVMTAGNKRITWNGRNSIGNPVGSGVYFYRLQAGKRSLTKKMVLIR